MNNIFKMKISSLLATLTLMSSCSDWKQIEPLDFSVPMVEKSAAYYADLRAYKESDHTPLFVTFDNRTDVIHSSNRAILLPDSIDYVIYENGGSLDAGAISDMRELQSKRGTKVLCNVSMHQIEQEWRAMSAEDSSLSESDYLDYISSRTQEMLKWYAASSYDGIAFTFLGGLETLKEGNYTWTWGFFPSHIKYIPDIGNDLYDIYVARQNAFLDHIENWREANPNAVFVFMGLPHTITSNADKAASRVDIFDTCDYIIVTDPDVSNPNEWNTDDSLVSMNRVASTQIVENAFQVTGIPSDKLVFSTESARSGDDAVHYGYFTQDITGTRPLAIPTLAAWITTQVDPTPSNYKCVGMMIVNAEYDYFASDKPYLSIKNAIQTLNND